MTEATETAEATLEAPEEKKICMTTFYKILDSFPARERRYLIPMMTKVQNEFRFLPPELTEVLREELNVTRAEIYGIISFYPQFRIEEPGKYIFKLCYGTACFVKGAPIIAQVAIAVANDDTEDTLGGRVLKAEHRLYPLALRLVAEGKVRMSGARTVFSGPAEEPAMSAMIVPGERNG